MKNWNASLAVSRLPAIQCEESFKRALVAALAAAGLPLVVANPRQVRDFAKAPGQLAKTPAHGPGKQRPPVSLDGSCGVEMAAGEAPARASSVERGPAHSSVQPSERRAAGSGDERGIHT